MIAPQQMKKQARRAKGGINIEVEQNRILNTRYVDLGTDDEIADAVELDIAGIMTSNPT